MCTAWRPPTSPKGKSRRRCAAAPSRTQSVEGLLDSNNVSQPQHPPPEAVLDSSRSQSVERVLECASLPSRTHSTEGLLESTACDCPSPEPILEKSASLHEDIDAISDSVISDSDTLKRKRNFMDRCVNKVRSLIKK